MSIGLNDKKLLKKKNIKKSIKFHRPWTKKLIRNPKYARRLFKNISEKAQFKIFKKPVTTELSLKKAQKFNTLVLLFDLIATKKNIKNLMEKIYKTKVTKVNTLITPKGFKKAFIKLSPNYDALDLANKIGFI